MEKGAQAGRITCDLWCKTPSIPQDVWEQQLKSWKPEKTLPFPPMDSPVSGATTHTELQLQMDLAVNVALFNANISLLAAWLS